jgi:hypothetical protein
MIVNHALQTEWHLQEQQNVVRYPNQGLGNDRDRCWGNDIEIIGTDDRAPMMRNDRDMIWIGTNERDQL